MGLVLGLALALGSSPAKASETTQGVAVDGSGSEVAADNTGFHAVPVQRPRASRTTTFEPATPMAQPATAAPRSVTPAPTTTAAPRPTTAAIAAPVQSAQTRPQGSDGPTTPPPVAHSEATTGATLHREAKPSTRRFRHDGFVTDFRVGALGCIRGLCGGGHNVSPGFRLDGFIGGNIRGFVDFGLAGGWGTLGTDVPTGTNVLSLYGLDPFLLQQALGVIGGAALGIDLTSLAVEDSKLRAAQGGPLLRFHFIPRGRYSAYVGSGVQYNLFRAQYGTVSGAARLDFHGLSVPVQAGFGVHVHPNVAVGLQFDYLWTWYALANLDHAGNSVTVPVRVLDEAAKMQGNDLRGQLPQFWTFGLGLRARI